MKNFSRNKICLFSEFLFGYEEELACLGSPQVENDNANDEDDEDWGWDSDEDEDFFSRQSMLWVGSHSTNRSKITDG